MIIRLIPLMFFLVLTACKGNVDRAPAPPPANPQSPSAWAIGPIINREQYSHGMPRNPGADPDGWWGFDFPGCTDSGGPHNRGQSVNYVTTVPPRPVITGSMSVTYEIKGDTKVVGAEDKGTARLRLYFQRRGDDWKGTVGSTNGYRWWSRASEGGPLTPGVHTVTIPLVYERWGGVQHSPTKAQFEAALKDVNVVGFTFGSSGAGHGVCLMGGRTRFVLKNFKVR